MPLSIRHDTDRDLIVMKGAGVLSDADLIAAVGGLRDHPSVNEVRGVLLDIGGAERIDVTTPGIQSAAETARSVQGSKTGLRLAVIAADDVAFGFSRMYEMMRNDGMNVRVFREASAALQWLEARPGNRPPPASS